MAGSDRNNQGSPVDQGLFARLAAGFELMRTGKMPQWFSPLAPQEVVAPPDVKGRLYDYPSGYNINSTPRQDERVSFEQLRGLADTYDLLRLAIETRKDQMEKLRWVIRPIEEDEDGEEDERVKAITNFLRWPDKIHPWNTWLRMLLEDLLVLDAPAIYIRKTKGGELYALEPMDGATLKVVIDGTGRRPAPPDPAYAQRIKGVTAAHYTAEEIIYAPRNVRTNKVYGYSPVEQVLMTVNIALRRQLNQLEYYTEGNVPAALVGVPETWGVDQIRQFQNYWDSLMEGDAGKKRKMKFVPGDIAKNFHEVVTPPLKDLYDEWLARIICYAFSLEVTPFVSQVNRSVAETNREQALSEGLAPLQLWVKTVMDYIIAQVFGAPDLEFKWDDEEALDPEVKSRIHATYLREGVLTVDEVRAELGRDPLPPPIEEPVLDAEGNPVLGLDGQPMMRTKPAAGPAPSGNGEAPPVGGPKAKPGVEEEPEEEEPAKTAAMPSIALNIHLPEIRQPDVVVDVGPTTVHAVLEDGRKATITAGGTHD